MELLKFYNNIDKQRIGGIITYNYIYGEICNHKALKVPRCPVCSEMNFINSTEIIRKNIDFKILSKNAQITV